MKLAIFIHIKVKVSPIGCTAGCDWIYGGVLIPVSKPKSQYYLKTSPWSWGWHDHTSRHTEHCYLPTEVIHACDVEGFIMAGVRLYGGKGTD